MTNSPQRHLQERRERLATLMLRSGLDSLVASSPAAISFLTDIDVRGLATRHNAVVLRDDASFTVVASDVDCASLDLANLTEQCELWVPGSEKTSPIAVISRVVRRTSRAVRVGVEDAAVLPEGSYSLFGPSHYPQGTIVPVRDLIAEAMRIKDETEISHLREAADFADIAYTATVDRLHPELRAYEVVRNVDRSVRAAGGGGWWSLTESGSDIVETTVFPHNAIVGLLDRRPETGVLNADVALPFQLHPLARCYMGASGTTAVFRAPSDAFRDKANRLSGGLHAALETLSPGTRARDVHAAFVREARVDGARSGFTGFSVGTGPGEMLISDHSDAELGPGMAVALRAFAPGAPGSPGIFFQTTALLGETGAERLDTVVPLRLIELY